MAEGKDDRQTPNGGGGYCDPPKHSQFKSGQSGNPTGRPARKRSRPTLLPDVRPTAAALRAEAQSLVAIRDGETRSEITVREAVVKALTHTAMKGGVLAQRTLLELLMAEDEKQAEHKRAVFERWRDYAEKAKAVLKRAEVNGTEPPKLIPHPEDIVLSYSDLEVRIVGPLDEEEAARTDRLLRFSNLMYELMIYHQEYLSKEDGDLRLGLYGACYIQAAASLPPRLRQLNPEFHIEMVRRTYIPRRWEDYLRAEHEALGLSFTPFRKPLPVVSVREMADGLSGKERKMVLDWLARVTVDAPFRAF